MLRDGRHHTFAQFGAGTFRPGVCTHLSRHVVVDPLALAAEADHLAAVGVPDAFDRLTVDGEALLATPYHRAANRARELARGADRHGSCGLGVGEAVAYGLAHPDQAPRVADCRSPELLRRRLIALRDRLSAELGPLDAPPVADCLPAYLAFAERVTIVDPGWLSGELRAGTCVFEGAQGCCWTSGTASTRTRPGAPRPTRTPRRCWPRPGWPVRRPGSVYCVRSPPDTGRDRW
ncbi:hypothetical protein GCM10029963_44790 [Micromonospora andamanensis]